MDKPKPFFEKFLKKSLFLINEKIGNYSLVPFRAVVLQ